MTDLMVKEALPDRTLRHLTFLFHQAWIGDLIYAQSHFFNLIYDANLHTCLVRTGMPVTQTVALGNIGGWGIFYEMVQRHQLPWTAKTEEYIACMHELCATFDEGNDMCLAFLMGRPDLVDLTPRKMLAAIWGLNEMEFIILFHPKTTQPIHALLLRLWHQGFRPMNHKVYQDLMALSYIMNRDAQAMREEEAKPDPSTTPLHAYVTRESQIYQPDMEYADYWQHLHSAWNIITANSEAINEDCGKEVLDVQGLLNYNQEIQGIMETIIHLPKYEVSYAPPFPV